MKNAELADIFMDLADMEEVEGNRWQSLAYRRVATALADLSEDIEEVWREGRLREIEGVGEAIEKKIDEYLRTGRMRKYEEMRKKYPEDFRTLRAIQGLGPRKIHALYTGAGIRDLETLKKAIEEHRVALVPGFGQKSEEKLAKALQYYMSTSAGRLLLAQAHALATEILEAMRSSGLFERIEVAGSVRRRKETVGDLDFLCISADVPGATRFFSSLPQVSGVVNSGERKGTWMLRAGITCDLRFIDRGSFGAALQYFTGSKSHNIALRNLAISKGLKLNEYGLFRGDEPIAGSDEEGIYRALGLEYIVPELREGTGEIEAAQSHSLPMLVEGNGILGDLHLHSDWSDGRDSLEAMVSAAASMGYRYVCVTDHSASLRVARGLDAARFRDRRVQLDMLSEKYGITVLDGVEAEIMPDGSMDPEVRGYRDFDFVVASMHQWVSDDASENTARLIRAIDGGWPSTIGHPTGRLIGTREQFRMEWGEVFRACRDKGVALEINGTPHRSDLPWDLVLQARKAGVRFSLGSDAHSTSEMRNMTYAVWIARRGWLTPSHVLNTSMVGRRQ
ncbi:PHP domain-containing protein [Thermogymnomonas acidicola]|nr:PHP domain-containing protein [Thermogymnomonas acidicola]